MTHSPSSISVVIASKGRPLILADTLLSVFAQTLAPSQVILSVSSPDDLPPDGWQGHNVLTIIEPNGLCAQRNRALLEIPKSIDLVAFFDDDIELKSDYLRCAVEFMRANRTIAGFSGELLANGGIDRAQARQLLANHVPRFRPDGMFYSSGKHHILHGCNMVIRRSLLVYEKFDENLALYSYGEDYDLSMRLQHYGAIGKFLGGVAVHLETPGGRVREVQRGYALIANNWYFLRKGTVHLPRPLALVRFWLVCVGLTFSECLGKLLRLDKSHDWFGRMKGVTLAVGDIIANRSHPARIKSL